MPCLPCAQFYACGCHVPMCPPVSSVGGQAGSERAMSSQMEQTVEAIQQPSVAAAVGLRPDTMLDELGPLFEKYEIPIGLLSKLMQLQTFEVGASYSFLRLYLSAPPLLHAHLYLAVPGVYCRRLWLHGHHSCRPSQPPGDTSESLGRGENSNSADVGDSRVCADPAHHDLVLEPE